MMSGRTLAKCIGHFDKLPLSYAKIKLALSTSLGASSDYDCCCVICLQIITSQPLQPSLQEPS